VLFLGIGESRIFGWGCGTGFGDTVLVTVSALVSFLWIPFEVDGLFKQVSVARWTILQLNMAGGRVQPSLGEYNFGFEVT